MTAALSIVSIGMVTAVGLDAPSSCAAMRARLDGFQETRFMGFGGEWIIGAPVMLPRHWIGQKRMAHMASAAICEAFEHAPEARGQTAFILCLAESERHGGEPFDAIGFSAMVRRIAEIDPQARLQVVAHGRPSGHVALLQARQLLAKGDAAFVMIVGIDSYLTQADITASMGDSRIMTQSTVDGFIPGEAAAAILCTQPRREGLNLLGLGLTREPASWSNRYEDLPFRGEGMTRAYQAALDETGIAMNQLGYRISDLIGETYWFKQTALASLRLLRGRHDPQDLWSPAESLGNIGAAVVPLMIGMAWMAEQKGYAAGTPVLIEASNDQGACGAAVFARGAAHG